jgi:RimJ/RimL family protein N-acetyltransferase
MMGTHPLQVDAVAVAARMRGAGRLPPSPQRCETVTLRDGATVGIRIIRPDDAPRLKALYSRLSPESTYFRFLEIRKGLSDEEVKRLAEVDTQMCPALVATRKQAGREDIIAVARYAIIETAEPGLAELSIVVEDCYQGRGLGTQLLRRLVAYARSHGVHTLLAVVHSDNVRMARLIQRSGLPTRSRTELGTREIWIGLEGRPGRRDPTDLGRRGRPSSASSSAAAIRTP